MLPDNCILCSPVCFEGRVGYFSLFLQFYISLVLLAIIFYNPQWQASWWLNGRKMAWPDRVHHPPWIMWQLGRSGRDEVYTASEPTLNSCWILNVTAAFTTIAIFLFSDSGSANSVLVSWRISNLLVSGLPYAAYTNKIGTDGRCRRETFLSARFIYSVDLSTGDVSKRLGTTNVFITAELNQMRKWATRPAVLRLKTPLTFCSVHYE